MFIPARKLKDPVTGELVSLEKCRTYNDGNGFEIQALVNTELQKDGYPCFFGLPDFFDKKVLYHLAARLPVFHVHLDEAVELLDDDPNGDIRRVEITSLRGFLRDMGTTPDGRAVNRLRESLLRWNELVMSFHNNSLTTSKGEDGDVIREVVSSTRLRVFDEVEFIKNARGTACGIRVLFNKDFLLCNNDSFARRVPVDIFCSFTRPTAARLYEIVSKNFWGLSGRQRCARSGAPVWRINLDNLMAKLGTHRSRNTTRLLNEAVEEINERVDDMLLTVALTDGAQGQPLVEFTRHKVAA